MDDSQDQASVDGEGPSEIEKRGADGVGADREAVEALHNIFFSLWRFGSSALVGWMATPGGIEIIAIPKIRLFANAQPPRRVFSGERRMGRATFAEVAAAFEVQPIEIRLDTPIGTGAGEIAPETVERMFTSFAVNKTDQRAVFLLDIVGFSKLTPELQASQLSTLEFALNVAGEAAKERGFSVEIGRSTTGDGFYVWNRRKGIEADIGLFVVLALFVTYFGSLKRQIVMPEAVPEIRTCIGIGSHYTYHQPSADGGRSSEYIVGEVTISLARLIDKARGGQILIGDFYRLDEAINQWVSPDAFVERVSAALSTVGDVVTPSGRLDRFAFYLTGPRDGDGRFRTQVLKVIDKHGFAHLCYNAKLNIHFGDGEPLFFGLPHFVLLGNVNQA